MSALRNDKRYFHLKADKNTEQIKKKIPVSKYGILRDCKVSINFPKSTKYPKRNPMRISDTTIFIIFFLFFNVTINLIILASRILLQSRSFFQVLLYAPEILYLTDLLEDIYLLHQVLLNVLYLLKISEIKDLLLQCL